MSKISLRVNGRVETVDVDPTTPLLYVLGDELWLRGPKFGCGMAQCGACTVILRGRAVRSCVTPVSAVGQDNKQVTSKDWTTYDSGSSQIWVVGQSDFCGNQTDPLPKFYAP